MLNLRMCAPYSDEYDYIRKTQINFGSHYAYGAHHKSGGTLKKPQKFGRFFSKWQNIEKSSKLEDNEKNMWCYTVGQKIKKSPGQKNS